MPNHPSPLRYPGGKFSLSPFLSQLIEINNLSDGIYAEPFAGGAGAALSLLFQEFVQEIYLNDLDKSVYAFWKSILSYTDEFLTLLEDVEVTINTWHGKKEIINNPKKYSQLELGFATFFLNRTNRSGVLLNTGPIGGIEQKGTWKINARFNKKNLIKRIEKISYFAGRIHCYNLDAIDFLGQIINPISKKYKKLLVYIDPPYFSKGQCLYLNHFQPSDHQNFADFLEKQANFKWVLTYDDINEIQLIYQNRTVVPFKLNYSAQTKRKGSELLIFDSSKIKQVNFDKLGVSA